MHKILVFDLDDTLAGLGLGIRPKDIEKLKLLEDIGYDIAICSGKTVDYLCGFLRQVELKKPIMIGENGATFRECVDLPPKKTYHFPYSKEARGQLDRMKIRLKELFPEVWYQPNEVGVTPYPRSEQEFDEMQALFDANADDTTCLNIWRHVDSFDLSPKEISKFSGLTFFAEKEGYKREDFICIGNGSNDIPMFEFADVSIGVDAMVKDHVDYLFSDIGKALDYLIENRL